MNSLCKGFCISNFQFQVFENIVYEGVFVVVLSGCADYAVVKGLEIFIRLGWIQVRS